MTREKVFAKVREVVFAHRAPMCEESFDKWRETWTLRPWKLPEEISHSIDGTEKCTFDLRTLRFGCKSCNSAGYHGGRNNELNTVREWWLNDQKTWPSNIIDDARTPNSGDGCDCGSCFTCIAQPQATVSIPDFVSAIEVDGMVEALVGTGAKREAAIAATHAVILALTAPTTEACRAAGERGIPLSPDYLRHYTLIGGVKHIAQLTKSDPAVMRRIFGSIEALTVAFSLCPAPKKVKGALPKMARKSLGSRLKKNSIDAVKLTGGEALKDAARPLVTAMLQATPLGPYAAAALEAPNGDAALGVLVSVVAMLALPDKLANNPHIEEMLDDLQRDSVKHFTKGTYKAIAAPLKAAIAGELTAYAARMEALTGAVGALAEGKAAAEVVGD